MALAELQTHTEDFSEGQSLILPLIFFLLLLCSFPVLLPCCFLLPSSQLSSSSIFPDVFLQLHLLFFAFIPPETKPHNHRLHIFQKEIQIFIQEEITL